MKKALITGITGQDGSFLAEFLVEKGYEVHGLVRRNSSISRLTLHSQLREYVENKTIIIHYGDLTEPNTMTKIIDQIKPDEIYNLGAQSHVRVSFDVPCSTNMINSTGILNILESIRYLDLIDHTKVYQASTSEMFGKVQEIPQKETTPFYPRSPYGVAKLYGYWIVKNYREAYNIFGCNGILFNHESERRGIEFVTRKITYNLAQIYHGKIEKFSLGNLDAKRDWGYAKDYVESMYLMLQQEKPDDYVIATGETHTIRAFVEAAFKVIGIDIIWEGKGLEEKGINKKTGKVLIDINPEFYRPTEVDLLIGDPTKSIKALGWNPQKTPFNELIKLMVEYDLDFVKRMLL